MQRFDGGKLIPVVDYGFKVFAMAQQQEAVQMKIGALATQTGVHVETIRYYQNVGLMPKPDRVHGSVRRYGAEALARLRFIKRAQGLGFSLDEVKVLLDLSVGEHCAETRSFAEQKKQLVEKKISGLRSIQAALDKLIRSCDTGGGRGCPIIESLTENALAPAPSRSYSSPATGR